MNLEKQKAIIEAILFAAGRVIKITELMAVLEVSSDDVISIVSKMQEEYKSESRGIEIIKVLALFLVILVLIVPLWN